MDLIIVGSLAVIIATLLLTCVCNKSGKCQNTKNPCEDADKIVKERRKAIQERPAAQAPDLQYLNLLQGAGVLPRSRKPRRRDGKIILYHYTTYRSAMSIQSQKLIKSSDQNTEPQHRRYGEGVYFTSYSPHDLEPDKLALNCFTHRGRVVTSPGIYSRTRYFVEIEFYRHEVEELDIFDRDVYIFRGSINLRDYHGRYKIDKNPRHPYDPEYSFYIHNIGY